MPPSNVPRFDVGNSSMVVYGLPLVEEAAAPDKLHNTQPSQPFNNIIMVHLQDFFGRSVWTRHRDVDHDTHHSLPTSAETAVDPSASTLLLPVVYMDTRNLQNMIWVER